MDGDYASHSEARSKDNTEVYRVVVNVWRETVGVSDGKARLRDESDDKDLRDLLRMGKSDGPRYFYDRLRSVFSLAFLSYKNSHYLRVR